MKTQELIQEERTAAVDALGLDLDELDRIYEGF